MLLLILACSSQTEPVEPPAPPATPPPAPAPPAPPAEPQAPSEETASAWLVGEWGSDGATLSLKADGSFAFTGTDPCGQDGLSGTWELSRRTPSWVNARLSPEQGEPTVLALGVPLDARPPSHFGADCEKDPIGMEPRTSWSRQ